MNRILRGGSGHPLLFPNAMCYLSAARRITYSSLLAAAAFLLLTAHCPARLQPDPFRAARIPFPPGERRDFSEERSRDHAGGVAIFDYNGDGRPDIFFTNGANIATLKKDSPKYRNRLFRNDGNGVFTDVTDAAGLAGTGYDMEPRWPTTTTTDILISLSPACTTARCTTTTATAPSPTYGESRPRPF